MQRWREDEAETHGPHAVSDLSVTPTATPWKWASAPFVPLSVCFCLNLLVHWWNHATGGERWPFFWLLRHPFSPELIKHWRMSTTRTLTVWPNLHTQQNDIYRKTRSDSIKMVPFPPPNCSLTTVVLFGKTWAQRGLWPNRSTVPIFFDTPSDKQTTIHLKCHFHK